MDATGETRYGELDGLANQVARSLADAGIGPGERVGLWAHKSARAVAAMQGVLRLGAIYVPIDPFSPLPRLVAILEGKGTHALYVGRVNRPRNPAGR